MSWILGFSGRILSPALRAGIEALHPSARCVSVGQSHYVAAGGLPETCLHGTLAPTDPTAEWFVAGIGLRREGPQCSVLSSADWQTLLSASSPDLAELNGHFVAVRIQAGRIECFTDVLCLRVFYLARIKHGVFFSTRADWLARLLGGLAIDLAAFGPHWLAFNQLSTGSMIRGLTRVGPSGHVVCSGSDLRKEERPWTPAPADADRETFAETLYALAHPRLPEAHIVSLGLSGGIDSRLLLALHAADPVPLQTHVFGDPAHPDVRISRLIAEREHIPQVHLNEPVPDADTCVALLRRFAARTHASFPASAILGLRYFETLRHRDRFMLDGGFGEIGRRQFLNRLLYRGRDALRTGRPEAVLPYLSFHRADVFSAEAAAVMRRGMLEQAAALWGGMPPLEEIGRDNFLDLLAVRTRLPAYAFEQSRLDGLIPCYMPLAQPAFLRAVFALDPRLRRGGRLYRRLIRRLHPALTQYPLVKGATTYPFALPAPAAHLWGKAKPRLTQPYVHTARFEFLDAIKPFALDTLHSEPVRTYAPYDHAQLSRLVEGYYEGDRARAAEVDWWLSFELWRQSLAAV